MSDPAPITDDGPVDRRVAGVLLVDRRGWLLLQHRSDDAPVAAGLWGIPGGGIEPGETPEQAARREIGEETGLAVEDLSLVWEGVLQHPYGRMEHHVFATATAARDEDVVLGEGAAIVFVDPATVHLLPLASSATTLLTPFLHSGTYAALLDR